MVGAPGHAQRLQIALPNYARNGKFGAFSAQDDIYRRVSVKRIADSRGTEEVPVRALDPYALEHVFLLRVEVEGAELQVLQGASKRRVSRRTFLH